MNCHQVHVLLARYCDGETEPKQAGALEQHLARCPTCRAEYDELRSALPTVRQAAQRYPRLHASPDFDRRVLDAVLQRTAQPESLLDRLDAVFARPLLKLLGTSALGIICGLVTVALLMLPASSLGAFKLAVGTSTATTQASLANSARAWPPSQLYALRSLRPDLTDATSMFRPDSLPATPPRTNNPHVNRRRSQVSGKAGLL